MKSVAFFLTMIAFVTALASIVVACSTPQKGANVPEDKSGVSFGTSDDSGTSDTYVYDSTDRDDKDRDKEKENVDGTASQDESKASDKNQAADNTEQELLDLKTFYFAFDKANLSDLAMDSLGYHAKRIKQKVKEKPDFLLLIEGHTDERGTAEYNIALGLRRADAVSRFLRVNGVPAANIKTISYGEERPAALGSTEAAWAKNRRAQLVY